MFETLNDFTAINDILFSSIITVYRLIIDNELSLQTFFFDRVLLAYSKIKNIVSNKKNYSSMNINRLFVITLKLNEK